MRMTKTELADRASFLVLHVQPALRQVCLAGDGDVLDHHDGVTRVLGILRGFFAQGAADAIHQQVT